MNLQWSMTILEVLNLIINGIPSIPATISPTCIPRVVVLNLIINGIPSIPLDLYKDIDFVVS